MCFTWSDTECKRQNYTMECMEEELAGHRQTDNSSTERALTWITDDAIRRCHGVVASYLPLDGVLFGGVLATW